MGKKTIYVTVHGIGDQIRNETTQAVATRVFANKNEDPPLPLGAFCSKDQLTLQGAYFPTQDSKPGEIGFAEVYWADITRDITTSGYTLEEAKAWAQTIVRRQKRSDQKKADEEAKLNPMKKVKKKGEIDYILLEMVLNELIRTVAVTERLLSLARAANLGSFNLKEILDQFLGDVQFVTEFKKVREEILERFSQVMESIHTRHPGADIVVVAHSEGTVVAFMGLLQAACADSLTWLNQVKALMTLGSPIDKHLILWPDIWDEISKPEVVPDQPILWWNYFDYGDPVGFKLDTALGWLKKNGFNNVGQDKTQNVPGKQLFDFDSEKNVGFTRYLFPGKAHVDYWADKNVFGHFLGQTKQLLEVKEENSTATEMKNSEPANAKRPESIAFFVGFSYLIPYLIVFGVLFLAVYAISKGAHEAGHLSAIEPYNLLGYTVLLAGVTLMARFPRLVRKWWRWLAVLVTLVISTYGYTELVKVPLLEVSLPGLPQLDGAVIGGPLIAIASIAIGRWKPLWGMKPMIFIGSFVVLLLMAIYGGDPTGGEVATEELTKPACEELIKTICEKLAKATTETGSSLWQLFIGGAIFLYLWWLAALLFDLVFVWHRNIRYEAH